MNSMIEFQQMINDGRITMTWDYRGHPTPRYTYILPPAFIHIPPSHVLWKYVLARFKCKWKRTKGWKMNRLLWYSFPCWSHTTCSTLTWKMIFQFRHEVANYPIYKKSHAGLSRKMNIVLVDYWWEMFEFELERKRWSEWLIILSFTTLLIPLPCQFNLNVYCNSAIKVIPPQLIQLKAGQVTWRIMNRVLVPPGQSSFVIFVRRCSWLLGYLDAFWEL